MSGASDPTASFKYRDELRGLAGEYPDLIEAVYHRGHDDHSHRRVCLDMVDWNRRKVALLEAEADRARRDVLGWEQDAADPNWRDK